MPPKHPVQIQLIILDDDQGKFLSVDEARRRARDWKGYPLEPSLIGYIVIQTIEGKFVQKPVYEGEDPERVAFNEMATLAADVVFGTMDEAILHTTTLNEIRGIHES